MSETRRPLLDTLKAELGGQVEAYNVHTGQITAVVDAANWLEVARSLRENPALHFEQLIDLCGIDYLGHGDDEWETAEATAHGYSRGVEGLGPGRFSWAERPEAETIPNRFAVAVHLRSLKHNHLLRLRCYAPDDELPVLPSLVEVWNAANWFEREAFDLFGIVFEGHPDLRRLLTDYGFMGHPFRKDFPLIGNVTVRYDAERERVVYVPTEIEPRVLVPRVVRRDSRYLTDKAHKKAPQEL